MSAQTGLTPDEKIERIAAMPLFSHFEGADLRKIEPYFQVERYAAGEYLYRQAERSNAMYLFVSGAAQEVRIIDPESDRAESKAVLPGDYLGEQSLFLDEVRPASVVVVSDATVLTLYRRDFERFWRENPTLRLRLSIRPHILLQRKDILLQQTEAKLPHIRRLPLFSHLTEDEIALFAEQFEVEIYRPGEYIYRQGENSYALYLFVEGRGIQLFVGPDGVERRSPEDVDPGEFVGERSLFLLEPRPNSLVIVREAVVLVLPKANFDRFNAAHPDIKARLNVPRDVLTRVIDHDFPWLEADEQVLIYARRHPWAWWRRALLAAPLSTVCLLISLLLFFIPVVPLCLSFLALALTVSLSLLWVIYCRQDWLRDWFVITNRRVVHEENQLLAFHETREQAPLTSIQSVNVDQSNYWANRFGYGDLIIATAGAGGSFVFDMLAEAEEFRDVINRQLTARKAFSAAEDRDKIREQIDNFIGTRALTRTRTPDLPALEKHPPAQPGTPPPVRTRVQQFWQRVVNYFDLRVRWEVGEQVTYRKHWIVLWQAIFVPTFWLVVNLGLLIINLGWYWAWPWERIPPLIRILYFLVSFPLLGFWWWFVFEDWRNDTYIVNNQIIKKIHRRPLWLDDEQSTIPIAKVQGVNIVISGIWRKMLDYGDVIVQTAAEEGPGGQGLGEVRFDHIYRPKALQDDIIRRQQREKREEQKQEVDRVAQQIARWLAVYHQATHPEDFGSGQFTLDKGSIQPPDSGLAKPAD